MRWKNLQDYTCPKCDSRLEEDREGIHKCEDEYCGFVISERKLQQLISKSSRKNTYQDPDRSNWDFNDDDYEDEDYGETDD